MGISFSFPNKPGIFCLGAIKIYVNEVGFRVGWRVSRNPKYKICGVGIVHLCDEI